MVIILKIVLWYSHPVNIWYKFPRSGIILFPDLCNNFIIIGENKKKKSLRKNINIQKSKRIIRNLLK